MSVGGSWTPLASIAYGIATHKFNPLLGGLNDPGDGEKIDAVVETMNPHQVPLEIGDEVYVFEEFRPHVELGSVFINPDEGVWYRGYVVTSASLQSDLAYTTPDSATFPNSLSSTLSSTGGTTVELGGAGVYGIAPSISAIGGLVREVEPVVAIGIFPKSHIQIREQLEDAERRLRGESLDGNGSYLGGEGESEFTHEDSETTHEEGEVKVAREVHTGRLMMEALQEEGEDLSTTLPTIKPSTNSNPSTPQRNKANLSISTTNLSTPRNRASITSMSSLARFSITSPLPSPRSPSVNYGVKSLDQLGMQDNRPSPPIPNLKCGDETTSGLEEPLIDEIACSLREWSMLLHSHLFNKNYDLFASVRNHIEVLHIGRRQLLAGSLSQEEKTTLRGKMVRRLVRGNREQGLDIIVRHPVWGGLVEGDGDALEEGDRKSWVSGVRMYAMQVALAYAGTSNEKGLSTINASSTDPVIAPSSNPRFSTPNLLTLPSSNPIPSPTTPTASDSTGAKFHHVFVDLKAFVASICTVGETAELYFSLFNKTESRYVTDEFCAILNHNGVSNKIDDSNNNLIRLGLEERKNGGRMRTLFTGFSSHDVQDEIFLVCRIVKNGSIKMMGGGNANNNTTTTAPVSALSTSNGASTINVPSTSAGTQSPTLTPGSTSSSKFGTDSFESVSETGVDLGMGTLGGGMLTVDQNDRSTCRRPFGVAVLEISQFNQQPSNNSDLPANSSDLSGVANSSSQEYNMPIFIPTNEASFSTLHEDIISSRIKEITKSPKAQHIAVNVKILYGEANELIKQNPTLLADVPLTPRLGFEDVVFPGTQRNDVFLKLWSGDFSSNAGNSVGRGLAGLTNGTQAKNVEVSVEIRTRDGALVDRVIGRGCGEQNVTNYSSMVFRANNNPTWGELVKLDIPVELIENCHAFFTFRSRGAKEKGLNSPGATIETPFAFAYFPLFLDNTAFMPDGSHKLVLYRYEKNCATPQFYFQAPPILAQGQLTPKLPPAVIKTLIPIRDTIVLRSFLVSTTYTQNETLLKLLQWEKVLAGNETELKEVLTQLRFCSEVEVCKFLRDIFDALFNILLSKANVRGEIDDLVFHALVSILAIVQDHRFTNFKPVLDIYIERHFTSTTASSHLMKALYKLLRDPGAAEVGTTLRSSLKVMNNIFALILRSRELQRAEEIRLGRSSDSAEAGFKRDLSRLLRQLNTLMQGPFPSSVIGAQTIAVHHFASILPDLSKCYNDQELANIAISFGDSVSEKGKIQIYKLLFINQLVNSKLFESTTARAALVPRLVRWLKSALGRFDEQVMCGPSDTPAMRDSARVSWIEGIRLSSGIIAVVLDTLQEAMIHPVIRESRALLNQEQDNIEYLLGIMSVLLDSYKELQSPINLESVERQRTQASIISSVPVVFPSSYPFSLLSRNAIHGRMPTLGRRGSEATTMGLETDERATLRSGLGEIACIFLVLVSLAPRNIFVNFLEASLEVEGKDNFARQLTQIFTVSKSILENEAYPSNWLNINIFAHRVLVNMLDPISDILERDFIPVQLGQESSFVFNTLLWRDYFGTLLKLLASPQLLIEDFSPQKRRAVWRLGDDIRGRGAKILTRLWKAIGSPADETIVSGQQVGRYQVQFVPSLVEDVLTICLSHHDELRSSAVFVLYSMIVSEYHLNGNFLIIEGEVIDCLDQLFMQHTKGDEISRAFFVGQLRALADESDIDEKLRNQVDAFLLSVNSFLDLLLAIRNLPPGEEFQEDRIISTLRLMTFVRGIGRSEIYIRYVNRLVSFHVALGDEVEAALTLKLHADLHEWDLTTFVEPILDLDLPRQTDFARKETLYMRILGHLGKGQAYETAISICKELQIQYETKSFSYTRLSELLILQAELYSKIVSSERQFGEYFRVAFYGNGFPASVSGKQFVHRAAVGMKLGPFIEKMLNKHPGAQLLRSSTIPSDEIQFSDGQHLQITSVIPEPDQQSTLFTNPDVPHSVRDYYLRNETHTLSFSRSVNRGPPGDTSFLSTWTEKTTLTCEDSFPTILRRSEVLEIDITDISPIETALKDVKVKTMELSGLEHRYRSLGRAQNEKKPNTNVLSMALNSVVDAPVNTGIPMYRTTFLESDYLFNNSGQGKIVHALSSAIDELVLTIARCLNLHGALCPLEMQPFHDTLAQFFNKNFAFEIARLPTEKRIVAFTSSSSIHPNQQQQQQSESQSQSQPQSQSQFPRSLSNLSEAPLFTHVRKESGVSINSTRTITGLSSVDLISTSDMNGNKNKNLEGNNKSSSPSRSNTTNTTSPISTTSSSGSGNNKPNGISPSTKGSISGKSSRRSMLGSLRWKKKDSIQEN